MVYAVIAVVSFVFPLHGLASAGTAVEAPEAIYPFLTAPAGWVLADRSMSALRPLLPAHLHPQPPAAPYPPPPEVTAQPPASPQPQAASPRTAAASRSSRTAPRSARVAAGLRWPVAGRVTSPFGRRWGRHHEGIDIAASYGDAILAAASGTVVLAGWYGGYGRTVIIDNGKDVTTLYGHASRLLVKIGEQVDAGQEIARVGASGVAQGPHLHFELRVRERAVDPLPMLAGLPAPAALPPVATAAPAPDRRTTAAGVVYRVQVGAFRIRENALAQVAQLREAGFTPRMTRTRALYKVQVGAFTNRRDAGQLAGDLRARGFEAFVTP